MSRGATTLLALPKYLPANAFDEPLVSLMCNTQRASVARSRRDSRAVTSNVRSYCLTRAATTTSPMPTATPPSTGHFRCDEPGTLERTPYSRGYVRNTRRGPLSERARARVGASGEGKLHLSTRPCYLSGVQLCCGRRRLWLVGPNPLLSTPEHCDGMAENMLQRGASPCRGRSKCVKCELKLKVRKRDK